MVHALTDRRVDTRFTQPVVDGMKVTLRPGNTVIVVDVSARGARIHSRRPLRPGARVHLQLTTEKRTVRLSAHVLRCSVALIDANTGVVYGGALKFDHRCDLFREQTTHAGHEVPASHPSRPQDHGHRIPAALPIESGYEGRS
jgi:hypothetical protein